MSTFTQRLGHGLGLASCPITIALSTILLGSPMPAAFRLGVIALTSMWALLELYLGFGRPIARQKNPRWVHATRALWLLGPWAAWLDRAHGWTAVPVPDEVWIVALALAVFGLALRAAAVARLGSRFTYDYAVGGGALETRGIYAWIRHPSYLGLLCLTNFLGIALGSLIGVALLASTIPAVLRRIRDEEAALVSHYGEAYDVYRRRAARLIPFVY